MAGYSVRAVVQASRGAPGQFRSACIRIQKYDEHLWKRQSSHPVLAQDDNDHLLNLSDPAVNSVRENITGRMRLA